MISTYFNLIWKGAAGFSLLLPKKSACQLMNKESTTPHRLGYWPCHPPSEWSLQPICLCRHARPPSQITLVFCWKEPCPSVPTPPKRRKKKDTALTVLCCPCLSPCRLSTFAHWRAANATRFRSGWHQILAAFREAHESACPASYILVPDMFSATTKGPETFITVPGTFTNALANIVPVFKHETGDCESAVCPDFCIKEICLIVLCLCATYISTVVCLHAMSCAMRKPKGNQNLEKTENKPRQKNNNSQEAFSMPHLVCKTVLENCFKVFFSRGFWSDPHW